MRTISAGSPSVRPQFLKWLLRALFSVGVALTIVVWATGADAEDIDIFARLPGQNDLPNVLIAWDSSANWGANIPVPDCSYADGSGGPKAIAPNKEQGTKFAIEKCAFYIVFFGL